jgi:uncharacterized protein (TIGR03435 family)
MFFGGTSGAASARKMAISELARGLVSAVGRPIVDRTGLSGEFDIDLIYQSDLVAGGSRLQTQAPPLTTALRDQLGLRLESGRGPIDVVIDVLQRPADN